MKTFANGPSYLKGRTGHNCKKLIAGRFNKIINLTVHSIQSSNLIKFQFDHITLRSLRRNWSSTTLSCGSWYASWLQWKADATRKTEMLDNRKKWNCQEKTWFPVPKLLASFLSWICDGRISWLEKGIRTLKSWDKVIKRGGITEKLTLFSP